MKKKTLYHKAKQGDIRVWSVWTKDGSIYTEYGQYNGEMQISVKKATPKNIGKKNETTAEQQAELEAEALYKFKLTRKYSTTQESAQEPLLLPMLAKEDLKKLTFPCYVQPKLDGVRCLAFWEGDKVKLISRSGKEWTVPKHINEQVAKILPRDSMFDGELYIHGKSCQTITSYVKKWRDVETPTIEYHIYDMPIVNGKDDLPCRERLLDLTGIFEAWLNEFEYETGDTGPDLGVIEQLRLVFTCGIQDIDKVKEYEAQFIDEGYEGAIARNKDGLYLFGYRSNDLIKIKSFEDAEFLVTGCRDGVGKFQGCAVFTCENDKPDLDGNIDSFECTVATSMAEKSQMFQERDKYIGKFLTVKFQGRTDKNLPRFPVGKMFRTLEDLSVK